MQATYKNRTIIRTKKGIEAAGQVFKTLSQATDYIDGIA